MPGTVEFHFQEFFRGEEIQILVNGASVAAFPATTRPQIGLAHVEPVAVAAGDRVTVRISGTGERTVEIVDDAKYWRVNLAGNTISIEPMHDNPGYV